MEIIGVIDLKGGHAVHARGGRRDAYSPVREAAGVTIEGDAVRLAQTYIDRLGIRHLYIADLDAIASGESHAEVLHSLTRLTARLYVDAGVATVEHVRRLQRLGAHSVIVGLETLQSLETVVELVRVAGPVVFSLDLRDRLPMGRAGEGMSADEIAARLPAMTIIVLDVARVGGSGGPDFETLLSIRNAVRSSARLLAGGAIRHLEDLRRIRSIGYEGALVATALHDGRLTAADVATAHAL